MERVYVLNLVYVSYTNVMNDCGECRLNKSRVVIARNRARRSSYKLDCTGTIEIVTRTYVFFLFFLL
ncbi:hypothetical protein HanPI659440_Chr10g0394651 [Helianthus annuus]|nr:hypothetical protein HanPI659440_Chr10g0394651 [Helianthus annuus]